MTVETIKALQADHFGRWKNREAIAESMIPVIGKLYRERNVVVTVFGRTLVNRSVIQILKNHRRVRMIAGDLSVVDTYPILDIVASLDLGPCQVDIGKLAIEYREKGAGQDLRSFVEEMKASGFVAQALARQDDKGTDAAQVVVEMCQLQRSLQP